MSVDCSLLETVEARSHAVDALKRLELSGMAQLKEVRFADCAGAGLEAIEVRENPLLTTFSMEGCKESVKTIVVESG